MVTKNDEPDIWQMTGQEGRADALPSFLGSRACIYLTKFKVKEYENV